MRDALRVRGGQRPGEGRAQGPYDRPGQRAAVGPQGGGQREGGDVRRRAPGQFGRTAADLADRQEPGYGEPAGPLGLDGPAGRVGVGPGEPGEEGAVAVGAAHDEAPFGDGVFGLVVEPRQRDVRPDPHGVVMTQRFHTRSPPARIDLRPPY